MTSYLQEQLKSINENKKELQEKYLRIQKKLELELEKNRILEMEGTIDKLKVQVNELSKTISGNLMPNNIGLLDVLFKKELDEWHKLQQSGKLTDSDLEEKRLILREKEINIRNEKNLHPRNENLITLEKFKHNLNKVDDEIKKTCLNDRRFREKHLVEIKPEIKIYDDILPIFRTMIGIIAKQQEEINLIKANKQEL